MQWQIVSCKRWYGFRFNYLTIKIDKDALKKNILKIRYNNGRKVNNKYLHDDTIVSNNMKNYILKNTNVNKLSKNEYHVYTLLNKYKNDNTNLLISSYLVGNKSTDLYNTHDHKYQIIN